MLPERLWIYKLRKFKKHNQFYFETLVLASPCNYGDKTQNTDFFQNTCFKETNSMAVTKISELRQTFMNSVFQLSHGIGNIQEARFTNNIHTREKRFCRDRVFYDRDLCHERFNVFFLTTDFLLKNIILRLRVQYGQYCSLIDQSDCRYFVR